MNGPHDELLETMAALIGPVTPGHDSATQDPGVIHDPGMPAQATEDQMLRWLWHHHRTLGWTAIPQATVALHDLGPVGDTLTTMAAADQRGDTRDRRIDMLLARRAKNPDRTGPLETMAIEVKVTRADFLSDVKNPDKQAPWRSAATRHAYAVPAGLVTAEETPAASGLAWVYPPAYTGAPPRVEWVRRAPFIPGHRPALPFRVLIALLWRVSTFEGTTRGWIEPAGGQRSEQDLRAELTAARVAAEKATREREKALDKAESWRKAFALAGGGVPCAHCGRMLRPLHPQGGSFRGWTHVDKADNEPCDLAQRHVAEEAARDAYNKASDAERERELRFAHRYGFNADANAAPWRAFMPPSWAPAAYPAGLLDPEDPTASADTA